MLDTFILNTHAHKTQDQAVQGIRHVVHLHPSLNWPNNFVDIQQGRTNTLQHKLGV